MEILPKSISPRIWAKDLARAPIVRISVNDCFYLDFKNLLLEHPYPHYSISKTESGASKI